MARGEEGLPKGGETKKEVLMYPTHFGSILCWNCVSGAQHAPMRKLEIPTCRLLIGVSDLGYVPVLVQPTYFYPTRKGYKWPLA